jgi:hypothetical protein
MIHRDTSLHGYFRLRGYRLPGSYPILMGLIGTVTVLLLVGPGPTAQARQDPLRIILSQQVKPNVLFVITRTTAMAGDTHGHGNTDPSFGCTPRITADCHLTGCGLGQECCNDGVCRTVGTCGGRQDCHIAGCEANKICQLDGTCQTNCNQAGCPAGLTCETDSGLCIDTSCPATSLSCRFEYRPTMDSPGAWAFLGHCNNCSISTFPQLSLPDTRSVETCLKRCHSAAVQADCHVSGCGGGRVCCADGTCKKSCSGTEVPDCHTSGLGCAAGQVCRDDGVCAAPDYYNSLLQCFRRNADDSCYAQAFNTFDACVASCWRQFTDAGGWGSGSTDVYEAGAPFSNGNTHRHKEGEIGGAHMRYWRPGCWIPFGGTQGAKGTLCWPSRMAIVKWALGDSMSIVPPDEMVNVNVPPPPDDDHALRRRSHTGADHASNPPGCEPQDTPFGRLGCDPVAPRELINRYFQRMNIGLAIFSSTTGITGTDACAQGQRLSNYVNLLIRLNPSDGDVQDVHGVCDTPAELEDCANGRRTCPQECIKKAFNLWMRPARQGGLNAGGHTPLGQALSTARKYLRGEIGEADLRLDDPLQPCRRKFVVLLTHGEHNFPSPTVNNPVDVARTEFAPDIRNNPVAAVRGVLIAFMDWRFYTAEALQINQAACWAGIMADRPDAGVELIPRDTGGTTLNDYPDHNCATGWNADATHGPDRHHHAFFAQNALEMTQVFDKVLTAIALIGDFVVSTAVPAQPTAAQGSLLIPSTQVPGWRGTLRRWDLVNPDDGANHVAPKLSTLCTDLKDPNKVISTGDPRGKHFHLKWDAGCSLLDQANPTVSDYNRRIFTVSPNCGMGDPVAGPDSRCNDQIQLKKDATTVAWLRSRMTNINWATLDFDRDGQKADTDDDDVLMLIDFILGGDGNGVKRPWLVGDIVGGSPVVVGRPLPYTQLQNIPSKATFDSLFNGRPTLVYVPANDGLLHVFRLTHDPRGTVPIEAFAFLPPVVFPQVVQLFTNYRSNPSLPTGQAGPPDFDRHVWTMSAPPSFADVWVRWGNTWRTVLFLPLGATVPGVYALDVTDPNASPPVRVLWYWQGADVSGIFGREVWSALPIGLSRAGGKPRGFYEQWVVGAATTDARDTDTNGLLALISADTGRTLFSKLVTPLPGALVPFHLYANMAFMSVDVPIYMPDALLTHTFLADTAGRVHVEWVTDESPGRWQDNVPPFPLNFGLSQPLYHTPAIAHALGTAGLAVASATGSIFETDPDMTGSSATFQTKTAVDLLDVESNTKFIKQTDPANQHREFSMVGPFSVDTNGDGTPDATVNLSPLTRTSGRPLLKVESDGARGTAFFLVFDPQVLNPQLGVCTGRSYLFPVDFQIGRSGASQQLTFQALTQRPLQPLGYGVVTGIVAGVERIVTAATGYGEEGVALPVITPFKNEYSSTTLPRLRSVKRVQ